jgi:23S rRNA (cytidine2498-2'-O)-methyltransferase
VTFRTHDAFTLPPADLGPFDWVFSDVICYPGRLLDWVELWVASGLTTHMVATIKMQGPPDWPLLARFAAIPGSHMRHLNYNKHELCWFWSRA